MALNQYVLRLIALALLPTVTCAQSPQYEPFPVETYEAAPAPVEANPSEYDFGETLPFDTQPDASVALSPTADAIGALPLTVIGGDDINLYAASVPVRSRFPEDRAEALQAALRVVLARLIQQPGKGAENLSNREAVRQQKQLIDRAPQLVQQYRYETPPPSADGFGPRPSQLRLRAEFSPSIMQREIQLAGLPVLTAERPTTLLWPLQQTGVGWKLLDIHSPLREQWQELASGRGFELFVASGDLPDYLRQLPLVELDEQLRSLGESLVVVAHEPVRVVVATGVAQRWSELAGLQRRWIAQGNGDTADGLATLFDGYGERSTATVVLGTSVKIDVTNINSVTRYAALQRYLQELEQVQTQQLQGAKSNSVTLGLRLRSDTELFRSALTLSNTLQAGGSTNDGVLNYRWAGN